MKKVVLSLSLLLSFSAYGMQGGQVTKQKPVKRQEFSDINEVMKKEDFTGTVKNYGPLHAWRIICLEHGGKKYKGGKTVAGWLEENHPSVLHAARCAGN